MSQCNRHGPISLAELCQEAVDRFGDDWLRIQSYVTECIALLPEDDRERLTDEVGRLLSFSAPSRPSVLQ